MRKIVAVLVLTGLALGLVGLSFNAPLFDGRLAPAATAGSAIPATATPPLMYAGVRG